MCSLLSLLSQTSSVSFESHQCPCPPTLHFCAYYHCFVYHFFPWCACHAYMMPDRHWGYTPGFSLPTASIGARVFSRLARSRKINLTKMFCIMAYFCYPLARLFYLRHSVLSPCFHTSLVIRFKSGNGQLPFTLCIVATAVYVSMVASICGARTTKSSGVEKTFSYIVTFNRLKSNSAQCASRELSLA